MFAALAQAGPTPAQLDALFDGRRAASVAAAPAFKTAWPASDPGLEKWLEAERAIALAKMEANISPPGAEPGAVAASPSRENPNYWYHWRRDAALTMQEIVALYAQERDPARKAGFRKQLDDYAAFVRKTQSEPSPAGLGEPKYNMDGTPFTGPWGRPQDDSPAEEASTLIAFASVLLQEGHADQARALYGDFGAGIKADLEYVSHRWDRASFDVWEEVKARHFDTETAQRNALLEGAWLARKLGDEGAALWYEKQADGLDGALDRHWDPKRGYLVSALGREDGLDYKASGLDSAVILAAIHRRSDDDAALPPAERAAYSVTDKRVLATAAALEAAFRAEYPLNGKPGAPAPAIGRYPEDRYFGGNPWVLLTAAFAQLHYMAAADYLRAGEIRVEKEDVDFFRDLPVDDRTRAELVEGTALKNGSPAFAAVIGALAKAGDGFLDCVRRHANADGSLSEQIDKDSGYMMSARDLTWNYASVLSALAARDALSARRAR